MADEPIYDNKLWFENSWPGWTFVDMCEIICPCGQSIELDGECLYGHKSPLYYGNENGPLRWIR